jgi:hypothetical protein
MKARAAAWRERPRLASNSVLKGSRSMVIALTSILFFFHRTPAVDVF